MTLLPYRISLRCLPALAACGALLFSASVRGQNAPASSNSSGAYGGLVVEDILARVNDQVISRSDYDRAMKDKDDEARRRGASLQEIAEGHKDLLRDLIDQQLWLSKAKELGINGETEVVKQLDEIRKKYNLETMEDLEKAAREQGISYEDFKANIRNQIVTQLVMRDQVGRRVSFTPGEVQRYYEAHKADYAQPESVRLSEILVSSGPDPDDVQKVATAKAKADDIEAKLKDGGDFDKLARSSSDGATAAEGGDMGKFGPGSLAKVFEDSTFSLPVGGITEPIHTKQGYVIFKVVEHAKGGAPPFKDVEEQVEQAYYASRMEPAIREYLTTLREQASVHIKPGYVDTGASPHQTETIYSAYTPPAPKKKKKVQRTRFRETEHSFRNKSAAPAATTASATDVTGTTAPAKTVAVASATPATMKAGKKEKIRFGQAPRETLPNTAETKTEDAGALPPKAADADSQEAENVQPAAPVKKTRYTDRIKLPKAPKPTGPQLDNFAPAPPSAEEVADRQAQSAPLGVAGDMSKKKKKAAAATTGEKTRMQARPKAPSDTQPPVLTPAPQVPGAPAPATAPKPAEPEAADPSSAGTTSQPAATPPQ